MNQQVPVLLIEQVATEVTAANGGDLVVVSASAQNLGPMQIGLSLTEARKLLSVLMVGIGQAHAQQVAKAGGAANLAAMQGPVAFRPTDYNLGQASSPDGEFVLLRLNQQQTPLIEVMLDYPSAEQMAADLLDHAKQGPPKPSQHQ